MYTTPTTFTQSTSQSRNSEFGTGMRTAQQNTSMGYTNSSVLSPIPGNNGSSDDTFQKNLLHSIYNAR